MKFAISHLPEDKSLATPALRVSDEDFECYIKSYLESGIKPIFGSAIVENDDVVIVILGVTKK